LNFVGADIKSKFLQNLIRLLASAEQYPVDKFNTYTYSSSLPPRFFVRQVRTPQRVTGTAAKEARDERREARMERNMHVVSVAVGLCPL